MLVIPLEEWIIGQSQEAPTDLAHSLDLARLESAPETLDDIFLPFTAGDELGQWSEFDRSDGLKDDHTAPALDQYTYVGQG